MTRQYKNHKIIKTDITTTVFIKSSIGHRTAIRNLYRIEGEYQTGPMFTTIRAAKEYITDQLS